MEIKHQIFSGGGGGGGGRGYTGVVKRSHL